MSDINWSDRFWSRVARPTWTDCWIWMASKRTTGYGQVWSGEKPVNAHRHAFALVNGPIPDGLLVRHKCDNRLCVNPAHLELGTVADNSRDMVERGRAWNGGSEAHCGEANNCSKLRPEQVEEIRAAYAAGDRTQKSIASDYGVDTSLVSLICRGKGWRHLAAERARHPRAERGGNAKLSLAHVSEIRTKYAAGGRSQQSLADEYGVHQSQVWKIVRGKSGRAVAA